MATVNKGNLAEGILGAALIAKIIARNNGRIDNIKPVDVIGVLQDLKSIRLKSGAKEKLEFRQDISRKNKDKITLVLRLGKVMMKHLLNHRKFDMMKREIDSACSFVNSVRVDSFARAMYINDIDNQIEIDVDGLSNSLITKADVTLKKDKIAVEKISLKAGEKLTGKTMGQVGGIYFDTQVRLWKGGDNPKNQKYEEGLGLPINQKKYENEYQELLGDDPSRRDVNDAVRYAYDEACKLFNNTSHSQLPKKIYDFLLFHSARGDTDVKILVMHLGKHKLLDLKKLMEGLKGLKSIRGVVKTAKEWPSFLVYTGASAPQTITSKNVLFSIRPKVDNRGKALYISHLVEEGPLFSQLLIEEDE